MPPRADASLGALPPRDPFPPPFPALSIPAAAEATHPPPPSAAPRLTLTIAADQRAPAPLDSRPSRQRRQGRQRQKQQRLAGSARFSARRVAAVLALVLFGAGLVMIVASDRLPRTLTPQALLAPLGSITQAAGLGLDQIALTGHRQTADGDVFAALDLGNARHLVGFDITAARARIEALPWVATAELTRVYPGQLKVHIREREAHALWLHEGREVLIDETGRSLAAVAPGSVTHLPRVAGAGAEKEAQALMVLLSRYPILIEGLGVATRINERRWSLMLKNGSRIELPADGESLALASLEPGLAALLGGLPVDVDLRATGRIAVRPAPTGRTAETGSTAAVAASKQAPQRTVAGIVPPLRELRP